MKLTVFCNYGRIVYGSHLYLKCKIIYLNSQIIITHRYWLGLQQHLSHFSNKKKHEHLCRILFLVKDIGVHMCLHRLVSCTRKFDFVNIELVQDSITVTTDFDIFLREEFIYLETKLYRTSCESRPPICWLTWLVQWESCIHMTSSGV